MTRSQLILVTCEHGGNALPAEYASLFVGHEDVLDTHRGYDIGVLPVALHLADLLSAPIVFSTTTRLLIELNRSTRSATWFSAYTRVLPSEIKSEIAARYYQPYWNRVTQLLDDAVSAGRSVTHLSMHSFTPVLDDDVRTMHAGLLFDPDRPRELALCEAWRPALQAAMPDRIIAINQPYAGKGDGLTTSMRERYPDHAYVGIEVEVRNDLLHDTHQQHQWARTLAHTLPGLTQQQRA